MWCKINIKKLLNSHTTSVHEGIKYKCDKCDFTSTSQAHIQRHMTCLHNEDQIKEMRTRLTCDICSYKTTSETVLRQHKQLNHEKKITGKSSKRKVCEGCSK